MSKELIIKKYQEHQGQFVMLSSSLDVVRIVSIAEDEWDYLWVGWDGRKFKLYTCLEHIIPLKGHLRDSDYNILVKDAKLNHYDQVFSKEYFEKYLDKQFKEWDKGTTLIWPYSFQLDEV